MHGEGDRVRTVFPDAAAFNVLELQKQGHDRRSMDIAAFAA
jgi:hypothetical protein